MTILICLAMLSTQGAPLDANADYLRAAQIVANAGDDLKPPTGDDVLEWARNATKKYGSACDLVATGNKKPFAPLERRALNAAFPEFTGFRALGFLYEARLFEQIADGKPNQAADSLIEALTFGRRVQSIAMIGHVIGSQIIERNLRMFDLNRRAFAEEGLEKLAKLELIASIPADKSAMQLDFLAVESSGDLDKLPSEDRTRILARIQQLKASTTLQFDKDEALWKWGGDNEEHEALFGVAVALETTWPRALVMRTKLRLFTATAKVLLYEVRNYKLPDTFTEVHDPATGNPFFYGKRDDAFVMYSDGVEKTGRIELGTLWNRAKTR
ncbi:MAG: hypothetical protein M3R13_06485 [Armatimonadota bacterium]|nr:hypothetical protein [Armatimonadota bacterium]